MSARGPILLIRWGQSNGVSQTDTRAVTDQKYARLDDVKSWVWFRADAAADTRVKRTPNYPYRKEKSYPMTFTPLTNSRDWPGCELACSSRLTDLGYEVFVIQVCEGGSALATDWAPSGSGFRDYETLVREYTQARSLGFAPNVPNNRVFLVGMQGETDAMNGAYAAAYQANWNTFISALKTDLSLPGLVSIHARLSNSQTACSELTTVQAAQDAIAAANPTTFYLQPTNNFEVSSDNLHYTAQGATDLGIAQANLIHSVAQG